MDLGEWLRSLGLERYEAIFRENEIDEAVLLRLTDDKDARQLNQPATLMYALFCAPWTYILRGDYVEVRTALDELVNLANEKRALFWKVLATIDQGWLLTVTGKALDGIDLMNSAMAEARSRKATAWTPFRFSYLSESLCADWSFK
jgi:hypothetical protein